MQATEENEQFYTETESEEDSEEESGSDEEKAKSKKKRKKKVEYKMDPDHRLLLRSVKSLLQSRNASVSVLKCSLIWYQIYFP